jgi:hypothetical protein
MILLVLSKVSRNQWSAIDLSWHEVKMWGKCDVNTRYDVLLSS